MDRFSKSLDFSEFRAQKMKALIEDKEQELSTDTDQLQSDENQVDCRNGVCVVMWKPRREDEAA